MRYIFPNPNSKFTCAEVIVVSEKKKNFKKKKAHAENFAR